MALRLFLLAVVGLMSFELPSGDDVSTWTDGGNQWLGARLADLSQFKADLERAFTGVRQPETTEKPVSQEDALALEIRQIRADVAFESAMDGLASNFRTDLASIESALPVADEAPIVVVATVRPMVETTDPGCFDHETEVDSPVGQVPAIEPNPSIDRLSSAVRLTRQALSAWASLIEASPEDSR